MPRVAVIASHPIQYQAPWFQALARRLDLVVFFAHRQDARGQAAAGFGHEFEWDVPLLEGYEHEWMHNVAARPSVDVFAGCDTPEVFDRLAGGRFDACIVNGWYLKSYLQTIRACRSLGLPLLMRGDSHLRTPRSALVSLAKHLPYRWMLSQVAAHLYVGEANRQYLDHYGVPARRLFFAPHFVDNDRFRTAANQARADGAAEAIRRQVGPDVDHVFVFAGKLIDKKRPQDFIHALALVRQAGLRAAGLVIGSGPLGADLAVGATHLGVPVAFLGFRNQTEIPACYAAGDCLILPSDGRETWGLVVNEAMACGLPVITSDACGCSHDLAVSPAGETFPVEDVEGLAVRMIRMTEVLRHDPGTVRHAIASRIDRYSCEAAVTGTLAAVQFALEGRVPREAA
jgi:glycosyltransferase involved in cell wall biosynthesis